MKRLTLAISLMCLALTMPAMAATPGTLVTALLPLQGGHFKVRIGVQRPQGASPIGDVLYVHGFADRLDNHGPLFDAWNRAGLRVIAFDLPSHGENEGLLNHLNLFSFEALGELVKKVESATREDASRPLILAGWSTGGLIVTRMLQEKQMTEEGSRAPQGAILIAPAVSVPKLVGELGVVTERTLTHNPKPPHRGPIKPSSPLLTPIFAGQLLLASLDARKSALPGNLPTLVLIADDSEDRYVDTPGVRAWALNQRQTHAVPLLGIACPGARHELDNEPDAVGAQVRGAAMLFAQAIALGDSGKYELASGMCRPF